MFHVGQKVVCVSAMKECNRLYEEINPEVGEIYTIRDLRPSNRWTDDFVLRLFEIRNREYDYKNGRQEAWFRSTHFRPIVERKTDISIFTEMLTPSRQKETVR